MNGRGNRRRGHHSTLQNRIRRKAAWTVTAEKERGAVAALRWAGKRGWLSFCRANAEAEGSALEFVLVTSLPTSLAVTDDDEVQIVHPLFVCSPTPTTTTVCRTRYGIRFRTLISFVLRTLKKASSPGLWCNEFHF